MSTNPKVTELRESDADYGYPYLTFTLPNKQYSEHCQDIEEESDQRTLGKEMRKEIYVKYRWRKMEAAAQDRALWRQVVCGLCSTGSNKVTRHKSSHYTQWLRCFSNLDRSRSIRVKCSAFIIKSDLLRYI